MIERQALIAAVLLYLASAGAGLFANERKGGAVFALAALGGALVLHTLSIGLRWDRLGHGPYVNLYEILSSNVWSLHMAVLAAALFSPLMRRAIGFLLAPVQILTLWMLAAPPIDSALPVTYSTPWLPVHIALGKIFLGLTLLAVGLSLVVLGRRRKPEMAARLPASAYLEEAAYRLMLAAVIFESLMLIAGAAWAQDAWGRYWAWDPLEIWAFSTWACVIAYLHWRAAKKPVPEKSAIGIISIFVIAFLTFFGVPFISEAPHKGAI